MAFRSGSMEGQAEGHKTRCTSLIQGYARRTQRLLRQIIPQSIVKLLFNLYFIENPNEHVWQIIDPQLLSRMKAARAGEGFRSPIFWMHNFRWELKCFPNGDNSQRAGSVLLFLYLVALSPKIDAVQIDRGYTLVETNTTKRNHTTTLTHDKMYAHSWKMAKAKTTELQPLSQVTFKVNINLRSVFDKNGRDVTRQFVSHQDSWTDAIPVTRYQQSLEDKLDSLLLRMDEMQDDIDRIQTLHCKVEEMEKQMSSFALHNDGNPERQKLKRWLTDKVKLPEYFELFIENGVEDLCTVQLLDEESLRGIGMDKIGHRLKMIHHIEALKTSEGL